MAAGPKSEPTPPAAMAAEEAEVVVNEELRKVFQRYDTNGDGRISASELRGLVARLGKPGGAAAAAVASTDDVALMMEELDIDKDGFVDFQEFTEFFARHGGGISSGSEGKKQGSGKEVDERQLRDAFDVYDLDGNGRISARELYRVMNSLGEKCSMGDCSRIIRSVDADGDGCVDFQEFKKMMAAGGLAGGGGDANGGKNKNGSGTTKNKKRWLRS